MRGHRRGKATPRRAGPARGQPPVPTTAVPGYDCDFEDAILLRIEPAKLILALDDAKRVHTQLRAALKRAKER